ncbi:MAG: hypothetical protein OXM55_00300 [Bdellovibrionales bacterium]|nr:hypothetical protein [Bdellovibrionales bacterium]
MKESTLYLPVKNWINNYLKRNLKTQKVKTYIGADEFISKILIRENLYDKIINSHYFNIKIDVFSVVIKDDKAELVLIECKSTRLGLIHLSQLIGYSRIINPLCSILLSPEEITTGLKNFLNNQGHSLLNYGNNRKIVIAKWIASRGEIDIINCLPKGYLSPSKMSIW